MEKLEIQMHPEMVRSLQSLAAARDVTIGQLLRNLSAKEISRANNARPPVRADEQLIAPLRASLANDLAHSKDWGDLQNRLRTKGYELREAGGGLALHTFPSGIRQCKASELGFSYSKLMRRFHAPFPGHAHHWLEDRFLNAQPEETEVIERF